ncbi:hypothetical protein CRE_08359 [Caenorhabditis remanei]|uniref:SPK domain-containing protein n=1 Tax=Caenorhabditis remanei TaxID=31234 RepID=E3MPM2_CAERE|nr:hypothetical protein CRE_08359 [Caenorhabditis remanei]
MDYYIDTKFGIDWTVYEQMYPKQTRSKFINQIMEINMLQLLLKHGLEQKPPVSLSDFWRQKITEEKCDGKWTVFKNQLVEENCQCEYDGNGRILSIISDDNEIKVKGSHRKIAKKENPKSEEEDSEEESEDRIKTTGNFYERIKHLLDSCFKFNQMNYVMYFGLKQEAKDKQISNGELLALLEKLSKVVAESEDEQKDVAKMKKFHFLLMINSMASVMPGNKGTKSRIDLMFRMESTRQQSISLFQLGQYLVEILEE